MLPQFCYSQLVSQSGRVLCSPLMLRNLLESRPRIKRKRLLGAWCLAFLKAGRHWTNHPLPARKDFATSMEPGLKQYALAGAAEPRLDQFYICQKEPHEGQIIAWSIEIPAQTAFLQKMLETEQKSMESRQSAMTSGQCRKIQVDGADVVRVDVKLKNGATTTNLHFWSPDDPTKVTVIMIGIGPDSPAATLREADSIIASVSLAKPPATKPSTTQPTHNASIPDVGEDIRAVVEKYFISYMKADLDQMLATLDSGGPMYPSDAAIKQLRRDGFWKRGSRRGKGLGCQSDRKQ